MILIKGTQTLKGYPMYKEQCSSSDKEMIDEIPPREHRSRRRMSLRSREALSTNKSRHVRDSGSRSLSNNRELKARQYRLRDRSEHDHDRQNSNQEVRGRPCRERNVRNHLERDRSLRSSKERRISEPIERELRSRHQSKEINHEDKSDHDVYLRSVKDNQNKANINVKTEPKDNIVDNKVENNEKVLRFVNTILVFEIFKHFILKICYIC